MNTSIRIALVPIAAILLSLTHSSLLAAPADPVTLRWNELPFVLEGRQISAHLKDGATVQGKYSKLLPESLLVRVVKTSDAAKYPIGDTNWTKPQLTQITVMRHTGWKGRTIGLTVGGVIAVAIGVSAAAIAHNEGGSGYAVAGLTGGGASLGIGYLVGWTFDRVGSKPPIVVRISPEEAIR